MEHLVALASVVLGLGIAAQWLAWRFQIPAIVLLAAGGLILGPATGILDPEAQFGDVLDAIVAIAVAIILFEGGLSLHIRELRGTAAGVLRLTLVGAPVGWLIGTLVAHSVGGLSWPTAAVLGGILVVTGPTVIAPLLRQARLARKPAVTLKWEGIVNDPLGALFAVIAYEVAIALGPEAGGTTAALAEVIAAALLAALVGFLAGLAIAWAFRHGHVPEFLKAPLLIGAVLACFAGTNAIVEETGLVAVTVFGITLGNSRVAALEEIRRIKEVLATVLISGVFVVLTATLNAEILERLDWHHLVYLAAVLFIARPLTVFLSMIGTGVPWSNQALLAWIAPRGIVAVAISGLFGAKMVEAGYPDGALLVPLCFAVVLTTVVLHGFSLGPIARLLNLTSGEKPGLLIVGASDWALALAQQLDGLKVQTVIADSSWSRLRDARQAGVKTYHGEVLSEVTEHHLEFANVGYVLAATDNDAYNTLVCTDLAPEIGYTNVYQVGDPNETANERLTHTHGGSVPEVLKPGIRRLNGSLARGWSFSRTRITEEYTEEEYRRRGGPESNPLLVLRENGNIVMPESSDITLRPGDVVIAFGPDASKDAETRKEEKRAKQEAAAGKSEKKNPEQGGT